MTISNHILSLKCKYEQINHMIQIERSRPLPDSLILFDLKLKRLRLKERIYSLL